MHHDNGGTWYSYEDLMQPPLTGRNQFVTLGTMKQARSKPETLAARLDRLRVEAGWSVYRLAQKAGLSRQTVGRYLSGENEPSFSHAGKLADALGISLDTLRDGGTPHEK